MTVPDEKSSHLESATPGTGYETDLPSFEQQVVFLKVADLDTTDRFYRGILGLRLVLDQGACRIYRVSGEAYLGFCRHLEEPVVPSGVILTLVSRDVDDWHRHLVAQGVKIQQPPTLNEQFQIYHCFIRDPDGYLVEIQRFLDPAWPSVPKRDREGP